MKLVIDTNRLIAALMKDGTSRRILMSRSLEFLSVGHVLEELGRHKDYILKKASIDDSYFKVILEMLAERMTIVPDELVKSKMEEAIGIMAGIDIDDSPILACALCTENDGIWSEDLHLSQQVRVKVYNNDHLLKLI